MNESEKYKKIPWIYEIHEVFENNFISRLRLDSFPENVQRFLVYKVLHALSKYFSQIPDHYSEISISDIDNPKKIVDSLNNTLPTWLSGLCDTTIEQIISGLLDILNLKTEYQKWPPKSVMEFYAVCKKNRPPYYEIIQSNNFKQISCDNDLSWEMSKNIATKNLSNIFKILGKDYEKIKERREIEKSLAFKS